MRGVDHQQSGMFSYISAERRVPRDHPLRAIRLGAERIYESLPGQQRDRFPWWPIEPTVPTLFLFPSGSSLYRVTTTTCRWRGRKSRQ
jgi:hypothetical protein